MKPRQKIIPTGSVAALLIGCHLFLGRSASAQSPATGEIEGRVANAAAGEFLTVVPSVLIDTGPAVASSAIIRGRPDSGMLLMGAGVGIATDPPASRTASFRSTDTSNVDRVEPAF